VTEVRKAKEAESKQSRTKNESKDIRMQEFREPVDLLRRFDNIDGVHDIDATELFIAAY
jgi:hypothetical protein